MTRQEIQHSSRSIGRARKKSWYVFIGLVLLITVLTGCTEGERGIFATIAIEEEVKKSNLVENATISGIVKGTFNGTDRYITVGGIKVFTRTVVGSDWDEISAPGSTMATFIAGVYNAPTAAHGGDETSTSVDNVYVVFQSSGNQDNGIYRLNDSLRWDLVYTPPSGTYIDGMIAVDDHLFVSTSDKQLRIWKGVNTPNNTPDVTFPDYKYSLRDGVRYGGDGNNFFLVGDSPRLVMVDGSLLNPPVPFHATTTNGPQPWGIGYAPYDTKVLAVTDTSGAIYVSNSTSPENGPGEWDYAGNVGDPASDILWYDGLNNGTGGFLVATASITSPSEENGRGYYEATLSGTSGSYSLSFTNDLGNNYEASELAIRSIDHFRHFGNGDIFALTVGLGLWSTVYPADGDNPRWDWE